MDEEFLLITIEMVAQKAAKFKLGAGFEFGLD
jgi:hypothetical protein